MTFIEKIYINNKELDKIFDKKYNFNNIEIINKNKIELFVELGELANETKCFKYWSKKEVNYKDMLYEYADGLMMILTFFNIYNIDFDIKNNNELKDISTIILELYDLYNRFINHDELILNEILNKYLNLGFNLNITEEGILKTCLDKIYKTKKYLEEV